jgi:hypothetical protein
MKPQYLFIVLSIVALGLVSSIAYVQRPGRSVTSLVSETSPLKNAGAPAPSLSVAGPPVPTNAPPFSWRQLESEDYHQYIANLRAFGCPEQTLRDIVIADITKLYAAREDPLKAKPKSADVKTPAETPEQRLERLRQLRTVQQEKRWAIKELLGIDIPLDVLPSSGSRDYHAFEVALKSLPPDKRDLVQGLQENYWQQADALQAKHEKKKTPEFLAESRQLKESMRQELAKVLSPQEIEDYDIRTSPTAKQLSDKLATYFRPSEAEFRQLFRAKRDYEDTIERLSATAAQPVPAPEGADANAIAQQRAAQRQALDQARSSALNQMNEQLKTALGENRYTEYERSQDRTYDLLARLGLRYNLPQDTVLQAYEAQKSFGTLPVQVADGTTAKQNTAELQKQLNDRLSAILGEQAARGYRRVNGGSVPLGKQ